MKYLIPILLLALFLFSCKDDEIEDPMTEFGYEYYPLDVGKYKIFKVDSVLYDGQNRRQSTSYRREEIISKGIDLENDTIYVINVSTRNNLSAPWTQTHVAVEKINSRQVERSEENLRFSRLLFPVNSGSSWDGNAYIPDMLSFTIEGEDVKIYDDWTDYSIGEEVLPLTIGGLVFDQTVDVFESSNGGDFVTTLRESASVYAAGVGLIKRTQRILDITFCSGTPDDPCHQEGNAWEDEARAGYTLEQEIIEFN